MGASNYLGKDPAMAEWRRAQMMRLDEQEITMTRCGGCGAFHRSDEECEYCGRPTLGVPKG